MKDSTRARERLARERDMLSAAIQLFCEQGFERTSMEDLARVSGYTKRTIYRYFTCKEDVFFAVMFDGYKILTENIRSAHDPDCDGLENIRRAYGAFYDFYANQPRLLRLMTMEGIIKSYSNNTEVPYREKLDGQTAIMFRGITDVFLCAQSDGSIRSDLDIQQLAYSSIFLTTGFFHLLSVSGDAFAHFLHIDREAFANFCIARMLDALRKGGA